MNDLIEGQGQALSTGNESWGAEGASQDDVLVPRLMLMQDLSDLVKQRRAEVGDIVHSGTGEVLIKKSCLGEIIPIITFREWHIFDVNSKGQEVFRKYGGRVPMTAQNANLPVEAVENGLPIRRKKAISFFVLFVPLIDELPFLVTFKKANIMVGKQLTTHFKVSQMKKQPPASQVFKFGSTQKVWEQHTFGVNTIEPSRPATPIELAIARKWYETFQTIEVKVADENEVPADDFAFNQ